MGFKDTKFKIIQALETGHYWHDERNDIDEKNWLSVGDVSPEEIVTVIRKCNGTHYECAPHHSMEDIDVHILKRDGWYIKFYFIDPETFFISVHK